MISCSYEQSQSNPPQKVQPIPVTKSGWEWCLDNFIYPLCPLFLLYIFIFTWYMAKQLKSIMKYYGIQEEKLF